MDKPSIDNLEKQLIDYKKKYEELKETFEAFKKTSDYNDRLFAECHLEMMKYTCDFEDQDWGSFNQDDKIDWMRFCLYIQKKLNNVYIRKDDSV